MTTVLAVLAIGLLSLIIFALYEMGFLQDPLKRKIKAKEGKSPHEEEVEIFNKENLWQVVMIVRLASHLEM